MERTSKTLPLDISHRGVSESRGAPISWEYRFSDTNESSTAEDGSAVGGGWIVVSSSTRRDQRRQYLLKRPLR